MDVQPSADRVCDGGSDFQQFLGNHCLLVDVVDICQVAAEGACLHFLPTRVTHHVARVPFACCDLPRHHPAVGLRWQLSPNPAGGADHGLSFCRVGLEADPFKGEQRWFAVTKRGEGTLAPAAHRFHVGTFLFYVYMLLCFMRA